MLRSSSLLTLLCAATLAVACAGTDGEADLDALGDPADETEGTEQSSIFARAYLRFGAPSSVALLGAPPAADSPAMEADRAANAQALAARATPRWRQAAQDADLGFPAAAHNFTCALDAPISRLRTPALYRLMQRSALDAGGATAEAKAHYDRPRPFEVNRQPICTPSAARSLRADGSYPSGHSAVGWAWALVLREVAPARKEPLMARGHEFGQSRVVCNVHWQSDVEAGRLVAEAVVKRLHQNAEFKRDLEAARREVAAAHARGLRPNRSCP